MRWCCGASPIAPAACRAADADRQAAGHKKKNEAERIAAQLAEPSLLYCGTRWALGRHNASVLKAALADTA